MKNIFFLILVVFITTIWVFKPHHIQAQTPEKMSYQAVVRTADQSLVTNTRVGIQISILIGSEEGDAVYVETHTGHTNENGLVSLEIGAGRVVYGNFSAIDWGSESFFIRTGIDPNGGSNYTITGASQLLSVPYALHAKTAETSFNSNVEGKYKIAIEDKDLDTRVITEQNPDEDMIRFHLAGTERWRMVDTRLVPVNTGNSLFIGYNAGLYDDLSDNKNTFVGNYSGAHNSSGYLNTGLGRATLFENLTGGYNTAVGCDAGWSALGNGNVFLGYQAGYYETGSDKLYIENSCSPMPLIYGEFDNDILEVNGKLGIGTTPAYELDIDGSASISNDIYANRGFMFFMDSYIMFSDIMHDRSDTYYKVDPNGDSRLSSIQTISGITIGKDKNSTAVLRIADRIIDWDDYDFYIDPSSKSKFNELDVSDFYAYSSSFKSLTASTINATAKIYVGQNNTSGADLYIADKIIDWDDYGFYIDPGSKSKFNEIYVGQNNTSGADLYIADRIIDWDNKHYYLDPNSTSNLYDLDVYDFYAYSSSFGSLTASIINATGRINVGQGNTSATDLYIADKIIDWDNTDYYFDPNGNNSMHNASFTGDVGIGTTTPGAKLEVDGQVKITGGSPGAGKFLVSDASGLASWQALTETDPVFSAWDRSTGILITESQITDLNHFGNEDEIDPVFNLSVAAQITSEDITYWDNKLDFEVDGSTTNELQTLSISDNTIYLTNGGFVELPISNSLQDTDQDTKIQLEKVSDEDIIRFDLAGTERWRMVDTRLVPVNTGNSLFIGYNAGLYDDLSDNKNTFVGDYSGAHNSSGYLNTGLGRATLFENLTGGYNTAVGCDAGWSALGNGNVFLGFKAGYYETGSDKLYIENSNSTTPLIYGEFNNDLLRINGTLDINNAYQLPTIDGTVGQILQTDGQGVISWVSGAAVVTCINELTDGKTGGYSVFLGQGAGLNDDLSNNYNTGIGYDALKYNTNGSLNTALGMSALSNNTTGYANTASGMNALYYNTTGYMNVATGSSTLFNNTVGSFNTASGYFSLWNNSSGYKNVGIGTYSGHNNQTGSGNIFIGYESGYNETGSDKLYIENSNSTTPLIYGEFNNDLLRINGTLDINNAYQLPTIDGTVGQILQTDGQGVISWVSGAAGATCIDELTDGKTNSSSIFLGNGSGISNTGGFCNTAIGIQTLSSNTDGTHNTACGYWTLYSNNTGHENIAIGDFSMYSNTTGYANVALGSQSLYANTQGAFNTTCGYAALKSNTLGGSNVAFGSNALFSNTEGAGNTATGSSALYSNTTGYSNIATGNDALYYNTTGHENIASGPNALWNNIDGSQNVAIGGYSGYNNQNGSGNLFLGTFAGFDETGSNTLYIDNSSSSTPLIYGEFDTDMIKINGKLYTSLTAITGSYFDLVQNSSTGQIGYLTSSARYKTNIRTMDNINWIYKLRPVNFTYKNDKERVNQYGLIAEEVEEINPDFVVYDQDGQVETVRYSQFITPMMKALQEQKETIDEQQKILEEQQQQIELLIERLKQLEEKE